MTMRTTPEKFWARVDVRGPDDCWEWQGSCNHAGYGTLSYHGIPAVAHRVAGYLAGKLDSIAAPRDRTGTGFGLHSCDNRKCCNPAHLAPGTYSVNQLQAYERGRRSAFKGASHANAKLTNSQVKKIRSDYAKGVVQTELARQYAVSQRVISLIVRHETYTNI